MPPKAPLDQDAFLAICFRNVKEKPQVDFDKVATESGMSVGGSKNKFREIMKKMGVGDKNDGDADDKPKPKPKAEAKKPTVAAATKAATKRKALAVKEKVVNRGSEGDCDASNDDDSEGDDSDVKESPAKKPKVTAAAKRKPAAATVVAKSKGKATTTKVMPAPEPESESECESDTAESDSDPEEAPVIIRANTKAKAKPKSAVNNFTTRSPTAPKARTTTSDDEQNEEEPKSAAPTKGKPRGRPAKKTTELETVKDSTSIDIDDDQDVEMTSTRPSERNVTTKTRMTKPSVTTAKEQVTVLVPRGTRASSKALADTEAAETIEVKDDDYEGGDGQVMDSISGDAPSQKGEGEEMF